MKIGIIVGSVRENSLGSQVGDWVADHAEGRDHDYSLVRLASFDLPLLTGAPPNALKGNYPDERVQAWSNTIRSFDAYIFVTPEYNHSIPGAFKNAFDSLGPEFNHKPVSFVGYGSAGGVRAIEHWRTIVATHHMYDVRSEVNLSIFTDVTDRKLTPAAHHEGSLANLFGDLERALD